MSRVLSFESNGWEDYLYWQSNDKILLRKINNLIKEILRSPFEGMGKPEPLKGNLSGYWSRRISEEHRLVYLVQDERIVVIQCRYHY